MLSTAVAVQLAQTDPDSVGAYLQSMPAEDRRLAVGAYQAWAEHDPAKAVAAYRSELPPEVLNEPFRLAPLLRTMLGPAMVRDPSAVAAAVCDLDPVTRSEMLYDVGQKWCRTDGAAAAAWAAALPAGPARDDTLRQFVAAWAASDSVQVAAFIDALPAGSGKSAAVEGFARSNFALDPDGLVAWLLTIPDEQERLRVLQASWNVWAKRSSKASLWRDNASSLTAAERDLLKIDYSTP